LVLLVETRHVLQSSILSYLYFTQNIIFCCCYRTFAYTTVKDRLPGILTKVIDQFSRLASDYHNNHEEVKPFILIKYIPDWLLISNSIFAFVFIFNISQSILSKN